MKYRIIYTNNYIKKKLVGGDLSLTKLENVNRFNKNTKAYEMLDPMNGFFFLKSDAILNYYHFGDDEYPITQLLREKKRIFRFIENQFIPSLNFNITIEELGKFLGTQYHNLYIIPLLEEYYKDELDNLITINENLELRKSQKDFLPEQKEQKEFVTSDKIDFNNFIKKYNNIVENYNNISNKKIRKIELINNEMKNIFKISYKTNLGRQIKLQKIFDEYYEKAISYYEKNKNYFNSIKNNLKKEIQSVDNYFKKLKLLIELSVNQPENIISLNKEMSEEKINKIKSTLRWNIKNITKYNINNFFRFLENNEITLKGLEKIKEPEDVKKIKEDLQINIEKDYSQNISKEMIIDEKIKDEEINDFNNFKNQFTLEFFSLFLSIFWYKAENEKDIDYYYDGVGSIFELTRYILKKLGVDSIFEHTRDILEDLNKNTSLNNNEKDFVTSSKQEIYYNDLITSSKQETFQTKLIERYLKFYSLIDLDNYTSNSYYEDKIFSDCGETTLRNFVKIISTNEKNKIDLEILKAYGASINLIKYFKTYDENDFKNIKEKKEFSLDIDIYNLSDKIIYSTNLTTEEIEYLKYILKKNETKALFDIYKNKIVDLPGSSSSNFEVNDINKFNGYLENLIVNIPLNISDNDKDKNEYNFISAWNLLVSNLTGIKYNKEYKICEIKAGLNNDRKVNILEVLKKLFPNRNFDSFKNFPIDETLEIEEKINLNDGTGEVIIKKIIEERENIFILKLQSDHYHIEKSQNDENTEYLSFEDCSSLSDKECFYLKFIGPYETNLFNNLEEILKIFNYNKFFYLYRKITNNESISEIIQNNNLINLIITKEKKNIYVNYLKYLINLDNNDLLTRMIFDCDYIDFFDDFFKVDENGEMIIYPKLINFNNFRFRNPDVVKKLIIDKEIHRNYNGEKGEISFPVTDLELKTSYYNKDKYSELLKDQWLIDLSNMNFSGVEILKIYFDSYEHRNFYYPKYSNITELYLINYEGQEIPELPPSIEKLEIKLSYDWKNFDESNLNIISTYNNLKELNITIDKKDYDDETIQILKDKIKFNSFNVVNTKLIFNDWFNNRESTVDYYYYPLIYLNLMTLLINIDNKKKKEISTILNKDQEIINNNLIDFLYNFNDIDEENKIQLMSYIVNNIIYKNFMTLLINFYKLYDVIYKNLMTLLNNINKGNQMKRFILLLNKLDKVNKDFIILLLNNFDNIDENEFNSYIEKMINYDNLMLLFNNIDKMHNRNQIIRELNQIYKENINDFIIILLNNFNLNIMYEDSDFSNFIYINVFDQKVYKNVKDINEKIIIERLDSLDRKTKDEFIMIFLRNFNNIDEEKKKEIINFIVNKIFL